MSPIYDCRSGICLEGGKAKPFMWTGNYNYTRQRRLDLGLINSEGPVKKKNKSKRKIKDAIQ